MHIYVRNVYVRISTLHLFPLKFTFQALGQFNNSLSALERSLALQTSSNSFFYPVRSIYDAVQCNMKRRQADIEYTRKLEDAKV